MGFYPTGLTMAPFGTVPPSPSAPSLSSPSQGKGLFYSGIAPLNLEDFMGPAHSRAFVAGLGRRLACPPVVDMVSSPSEEDLSQGLEAVTI